MAGYGERQLFYRYPVRRFAATLLVLCMTATAAADTSWTNAGTGSWGTAANWDNGVPSGAGTGDVLIQNGGTARIDAAAGTIAGHNLIRIGTSTGDGHLLVTSGGSAAFHSETRVGDDATGCDVTITGGSFAVSTAMRLGYTSAADKASAGTVSISGGSLTLNSGGSLVMGYGAGTSSATVEIDGTTPTVQVQSLTMTSGVTKTLKFVMGAGGVSSVQLTGDGGLAFNGTTLSITCPAGLSLSDGSDVTLIDNQGTGTVADTFSGLAEGATVTATYGTKTYSWTITYAGGTGNDVVLHDLVTTDALSVTVRDAEDTTGYNTWSIGSSKSLDTACVMTAVDCVLVRNTGTVAMDVGLSATGTNWTLGSTTGSDRCVLMGLFNGESAPAVGDFSTTYDLLSGAIAWATSNAGNGAFEGSAGGVNIAPSAGSKLYMYLRTPSAISAAGKANETITVTVSCKAH
jgi:hypothetical protein